MKKAKSSNTLVLLDEIDKLEEDISKETSEKLVEFIMPKKPLNVLKGILASDEYDVEIEFNESNAKFVFSNLFLNDPKDPEHFCPVSVLC